MLKWEKVGVSNLAGEISLLAGLVMWVTTFPRIRRKLFELFFYTHYLYIVFVVFFVLHVGFSSACTMLPGFYLFIIDRYLRFLQSQQQIRLVSARILPCRAVELNFSKNPGNILPFSFPEIQAYNNECLSHFLTGLNRTAFKCFGYSWQLFPVPSFC